MAKITIRDVAKLADVSLGTVSAVLNNQGRISKETRQRVLEVVNKLNYVPQYAARSLKAKKKGALGLATFWDFELMSSKYFREIVQGITSVTSESGYKLHLINLEQTHLEERGLQTLASDGSLDGMFFLAPTVSQLILIKAALRKFPFVIIGASVKDPKVSFVDSDNYEGGRQVVNHLVKLGHQRIAFVYPDLEIFNAAHRLEGYKAGLRENGLPVHEELIVSLEDKQSGEECITQLLEANPTAIFAFHDLTVAKLISCLVGKGIRVPEDIAIIGFDDEEFCRFFDPPITTVRQPLRQMGKIAAQALIERRLDGSGEAFQEVLSVRLIVRESCGAKLAWRRTIDSELVQS